MSDFRTRSCEARKSSKGNRLPLYFRCPVSLMGSTREASDKLRTQLVPKANREIFQEIAHVLPHACFISLCPRRLRISAREKAKLSWTHHAASRDHRGGK